MNSDQLAGSDTLEQPPVPARRSKKQIHAEAMAAEMAIKTNWKRLLPQAKTTWPLVPGEELAKMEGNVHKLAGAVQLRYHLTRREADEQVKAFFSSQGAAAGAVIPGDRS